MPASGAAIEVAAITGCDTVARSLCAITMWPRESPMLALTAPDRVRSKNSAGSEDVSLRRSTYTVLLISPGPKTRVCVACDS